MPYQLIATTTNTEQIPLNISISVSKLDEHNPLSTHQSINELFASQLKSYEDVPCLSLTLEFKNVDETDLNIDDLAQMIISMNNIISLSIDPLPVNAKKLTTLLIRGRIAAIRNNILKLTHGHLEKCLIEYKRIIDIENTPEKQKAKTELRTKTSSMVQFTGAIEPIMSESQLKDNINQQEQLFKQKINHYYATLTDQLIKQSSQLKQNLVQTNLFKDVHQFLCYAETCWKQIVVIIYNDLFNETIQLPESITRFNLTYLAYPEYEVNRTLINYLRTIKRDIKEVHSLHPKQLRVVKKMKHLHKKTTTHQPSSHNIWTYQEVAINTSIKQAKSFIRNSLQSYLQLFRIGEDRQKSATQLNKDINKSEDLQAMLGLINTEFDKSIDEDIKYNQNHTALFQRKAFSRYRQNLLSCKSWIFSICPPSKLATMVRTENFYLPSILELELQRGADYYKDHLDLKSLISDLSNACRNDARLIENQNGQHHLENDSEYNDNYALLLAKKLAYLERIRNHPDYDTNHCGLSGIYQSLNVLFQRTKTFLPTEQQQHLQACKSINKALNKMTIKSPSFFCLFSDSFYTIPPENEFNLLLNNIKNAKAKFYLHETMSNIKKHLVEKYSAEHITISYINATPSQLDIELEFLDNQTQRRNKYPLLIHIDRKQNKYVVEPKIIFIQNSQLKHNEMPCSK